MRRPGIGLLVCVAAMILASGCNMRKTLQESFPTLIPKTPSEVARDAFNPYDVDRRRDAIASLSAAPFGGEEQYLNMYRMLLTDSDPTVKAVCLKALGTHGTVEDAQFLIRYLGDTSQPTFVRWEAAKGLQRIHNPEAVSALVTAVRRDEDHAVRRAAASALGQYPQPGVFHTLVGALSDADFGVTLSAQASLRTLTGQDLGGDETAWLAWAEKHPGEWFANQQQYTVAPYIRPEGFMDKAQFWKERDEPQPIIPTGLNVTRGKEEGEGVRG